MALTHAGVAEGEPDLDPKVELLVQLAAFLAVGAAAPLLRETVAEAAAEGATETEMVGVLVAARRRAREPGCHSPDIDDGHRLRP